VLAVQVSFRAKRRSLLLVITKLETLASAGVSGHLCLEMPVDIRLCRPVLDTGSSGVRVVSYTDAGGSPAASHFFCFAKKSNQKKATPLHRPFGVPKISHQQRAARKLVARGGFIAKGGILCSPLKQCERTAPVAGAKFWRSNMGNSRSRCFEISCRCDAIPTTAVILSEAEGSAFLFAKHVINSPQKLGPRTSERRSPPGRAAKAPRSIRGRVSSPNPAHYNSLHRLKNPGRVRPHEFLGDSP
jgi:hypothetical protein